MSKIIPPEDCDLPGLPEPPEDGQLVGSDGTNYRGVDLVAGSNVTIDNRGDEIEISSTGGGGGITTVAAGSGIGVDNPTGPTATVTNWGVHSIASGGGLTVSPAATGPVTITNMGLLTAVAGSAMGVSPQSGNAIITNYGVHSLVGGTGITVGPGATGELALTNTGVTSLNTSGAGISVNQNTGSVTIQNTGVTSLVSASGVSLSANTGAITMAVTGYAEIAFTIDGGGSAITTGTKIDGVEVPVDCEIKSVTLIADLTGDIVIDIKKSTYSGFPTTSSITASDKPTLSNEQKSQNTTLTGWTKNLAAGEILQFIVDSASTVTRVTLSLKVLK